MPNGRIANSVYAFHTPHRTISSRCTVFKGISEDLLRLLLACTAFSWVLQKSKLKFVDESNQLNIWQKFNVSRHQIRESKSIKIKFFQESFQKVLIVSTAGRIFPFCEMLIIYRSTNLSLPAQLDPEVLIEATFSI